MKISRRAFDQIIREEVSSEALYKRKYQRPILPGGASGITVGIGYDLGHHSKKQIAADWSGLVSDETIRAMQAVSGLTGSAARAKLAWARQRIIIPWPVALQHYENVMVPHWEEVTLKALPQARDLPPDALGALVSLTLNRGPSYSREGERYREMRAIKAALRAGQPERVPDLIRSMRRLWKTPDAAGVASRRMREAALFERGLASMITPLFAEPTPSQPINLLSVQQMLDELGYHEVGMIDGAFGSRTRAAIAAFMFDRGMTGEPEASEALIEELELAKAEGFTRPIPESRATGEPKDSRVVKAAERQSALGWLVGGTGAAGILDWLGEKFESTKEMLQSLSPIIRPIKGLLVEYWPIVLVAGASYILYYAITAKSARIEDHRAGKLS